MALFGRRSDPEFNLQPVGDAELRADPALGMACTVSHMEPCFAIPVLLGVILPCPGLLVSVVLTKFHRSVVIWPVFPADTAGDFCESTEVAGL